MLVNNAGVAMEQGMKVVRKVFETNFFSLVAVTQAVLPLLHKSPAGRIVNLSSILGSLETNATQDLGDFASVGYNASKAAVNMYTVLLAKDLAGTPIKVNAAHPGWVKTDMGGECRAWASKRARRPASGSPPSAPTARPAATSTCATACRGEGVGKSE